MTMTSTSAKCPLCDSTHVEIRRDVDVRYTYLRKKHVLGGQEHTLCLDCGCSFFQDGQMERNNERFMAFAESIVKNIAPWEIHGIREKYGLSQEQANTIFNCGPTQFSKWERGEVAPTGTASIALREALNNPEFMSKLARQAGVTIHIEVEAQPKPIEVVAGNDAWSAYYATIARGHIQTTAARGVAEAEIVIWDFAKDRVTEPSVHTDFLVFDAAATRQRPASRIFISPHSRPDSYAILQGALVGDADERVGDWMRAPPNVPLLGLAEPRVKKAAKPAPAKGGVR